MDTHCDNPSGWERTSLKWLINLISSNVNLVISKITAKLANKFIELIRPFGGYCANTVSIRHTHNLTCNSNTVMFLYLPLQRNSLIMIHSQGFKGKS